MKKDSQGFILIGTIALAALAILIAGRFIGYWRVALLLFPVVLLGFHFRLRMQPRWRTIFLGLMCAMVLVSCYKHYRVMRACVVDPPDWDFLDFWIAGQGAVQGLNVYDPVDYRKVELPFVPGKDFQQEVLDVGLKYPPPSVFIFWPLGLFGFKQALILWYLLQALCMSLCVFLMWKLFADEYDPLSLVFMMILLLTIRSTYLTTHFAQTNFLAMALLFLFWKDRKQISGGIWLCLGMLVKPFLGLFLPYLMLKRQWKPFFAALVILATATLASYFALGEKTFLTYFSSNPSQNFPFWVYTEWMNQSLLSTILRITDYQFSGASPITHPAFVTVALVLTAATTYLVHLLDDSRAEWSMALVLILALIIYPSSMKYYALLLVAPSALLWAHRERLPALPWSAVAAFISLAYLGVHLRDGNLIFFVTFSFWVLFAAIGFHFARVSKHRQ